METRRLEMHPTPTYKLAPPYGGLHRKSCNKALTLLSESGPKFGCRTLSEWSWHVAGLLVQTSVIF